MANPWHALGSGTGIRAIGGGGAPEVAHRERVTGGDLLSRGRALVRAAGAAGRFLAAVDGWVCLHHGDAVRSQLAPLPLGVSRARTEAEALRDPGDACEGRAITRAAPLAAESDGPLVAGDGGAGARALVAHGSAVALATVSKGPAR